MHFFSFFRHFFFIGCLPPNCNVLAHLWCERMSATHGSGYFSWLRSNCLFFSACLFADIRAVVYMQRSFLVRSQVSFITAMYATFGAFFISISNEFIIFFAACIFFARFFICTEQHINRHVQRAISDRKRENISSINSPLFALHL